MSLVSASGDARRETSPVLGSILKLAASVPEMAKVTPFETSAESSAAAV